MFQTKKGLISLLGFLVILGGVSVNKQNVMAGQDFEVGAYVTCTTDTSLFTEADCNSTVVGAISAGSVATVVANDSAYTEVTCGDITGYLYDDYIGQDADIIAAYEAEIQAEQEAEERAELEKNAEIQELAAIIQCEAGYESDDGKLAVGAVVMNRVKSASYPNDINSVLNQSGQFTPVSCGQWESVLSSGNIMESCLDAAIEAYDGEDNTGGLLHFHRANGDPGLVIDNQVFF